MIQKLPEFSPAKRTSAHTDRIENNRMTKLIGTFPGKDARPDLGFIRDTGVEKGSLTESSDLSSLLFILRHHGTSAGSEKDVCNIIHRDRIGQTVDLWLFPKDRSQNFVSFHKLPHYCVKHLVFLEDAEKHIGEDAACQSGDKERDHVYRKSGRGKSHGETCNRVSGKSAENAGSKCFRSTGET